MKAARVVTETYGKLLRVRPALIKDGATYRCLVCGRVMSGNPHVHILQSHPRLLRSSWRRSCVAEMSIEEFCRELRRAGIAVSPQVVRERLREMCREGVLSRDSDVCRKFKFKL